MAPARGASCGRSCCVARKPAWRLWLLRHEGKSIRRSGVHVGAGSIQLIAALRATFLLMQCEDEEHQLLPGRQLVPAKVNISCPRSISLSLENVTRELPDFDGEVVEQLIPVAALGELGDLTADDVIPRGQRGSCRRRGRPGKAVGSVAPRWPGKKARLVEICQRGRFRCPHPGEGCQEARGVVRSLLEQDHTPRNNWPVVWSLPDMSGEDSDSRQSGSSRANHDAP